MDNREVARELARARLAARPPLPPPLRIQPARACQFPLWPHDQSPPQPPLFCGASLLQPGKPYCAEHAGQCGVPKREHVRVRV